MTDMTMMEARTQDDLGNQASSEVVSSETIEAQEIPSPSRSEAAICAMCVAVLRRVPSLGFVQGVEVSRKANESATGSPNWALKSMFPEPSRKQWEAAVAALDPWRSRYNLA